MKKYGQEIESKLVLKSSERSRFANMRRKSELKSKISDSQMKRHGDLDVKQACSYNPLFYGYLLLLFLVPYVRFFLSIRASQRSTGFKFQLHSSVSISLSIYYIIPPVQQINYRKRKIRRNMLTTNHMQGQVRCCQICGIRRITWVGPNVYAACVNFLLNYIHWHLFLFKSIFLLISISSSPVWITKINKCVSETFFFTSLFIATGQQRFAEIGDSSRSGSY